MKIDMGERVEQMMKIEARDVIFPTTSHDRVVTKTLDMPRAFAYNAVSDKCHLPHHAQKGEGLCPVSHLPL